MGKDIKMDEAVCYPRIKNIGLRGVTVADTQISMVDGIKGVLIYRGYEIGDLARNCTFEEIVHLLVMGQLPTATELEQTRACLAASRSLLANILAALRCHNVDSSSMDVLQSMVPFLAAQHAPANGDKEKIKGYALQLVAQLSTVVAAWGRRLKGLEPIAPDASLGHAANFLYMLNGVTPSAEDARTFDVCLILHADHTFNASTFAAREVASTRASLHAAVASAVGALSGELHGGANARVMEMLREIGDESKVEDYVQARLDGGERIMGMGHAVYQTMDPRAVILKELALGLEAKTGGAHYVALAEKVMEITQREMKLRKGTEIYPNVDFFSAGVYHSLGIPSELFTPVFAMGRVPGWCAHVIEEAFGEAQGKPALYRPKAEYVGDYCGPTGCELPALKER
jgi:citrate synthase